MPFLTRPIFVETSSYTPTLTGVVVGTGGTPINTAIYTFTGPAGVGARGTLSVQGHIKYGTSGQTFPVNPVTATMPSGFQFDDAFGIANLSAIGFVTLVDDSLGASNYGFVTYASATTVKMFGFLTNATYAALGVISTTAPFTWASNDEFIYEFNIRAERV